jgi:Permuted papain-like amidase enzyme, YaeF/YiiX, C92 family
LIWIIPVACSNGDFSFNNDAVPFKVNSKVFSCIKEGDILLRQGQGPFSTHIVRYLDEKHPLSHCGIVCNINNKLMVVHCISEELSGIDGAQTQSIPDFFADVADSNIAIVRPLLDTNQKIKFISEAKRYLNKKIKFDHDFNFKDTSKLYCSELVYHSYVNSTGKNPFDFKKNDNVDLMKFDSFFKTQYFITVWQAKTRKK